MVAARGAGSPTRPPPPRVRGPVPRAAASRRPPLEFLALRIVAALRPLHWSKNLLVFIPIVLAHRVREMNALQPTLIVFIAFCAVASGTYLINDYRDAEFDRAHPKKRTRPVASGAIS